MSARDRHTLSASVFVALCRGDEVLLLRRTATGWMDGAFSLPAGGLEAGETIAQAAIREALEEVGVHIAPADLVYVHTFHSLTEGRDWVGHVFTAARWDGTPRLMETGKHADLGWWPFESLPPETIPYVRQALLNVSQAVAYSEYGWGGARQDNALLEG
ncbi:NUDIX hydrolase [Bosea sp. 2RAB26]|uniref:NUDIX hydrolase n=1 Tax=Bosea sp. 2RAB26 TaxID=3237476 RepID=UPI003F90DAEF